MLKQISLQRQKLNYYVIIFTLLFGVILYDFIQAKTGFSYIDEILMVFLLLYGLRYGKRNKEYMCFWGIAIFYLLHSLYDPHNVTPAIYRDFIQQLKPYVTFYSVLSLDFSIPKSKYRKLQKFCKYSAFCLIPIGLSGVSYGGLMSAFGGPPRYATMLTILGLTYLVYSKQEKKDIKISLLICSIGLLSLRSKMFGFFAAFSGMMFLWHNVKPKKIVSIKTIIIASIILIVMLYVAREKIEFYFVEGTQAENMFARPLLYVKSWEILQDYPFFGTGLGSYATDASAVYYSPLYKEYGLIYSHEIGEGMFISDTYFPVFTQFGFVGIFLFLCFWYRRIKDATRNLSIYSNELFFKLAILIVFFFFIESTADSTLTHNRGMMMMILLAIILNNRYDDFPIAKKSRIR